MTDYHLKYPIGEFVLPDKITKEIINQWIMDIEKLPEKLDEILAHISKNELNKPYRKDGWTPKQVVHHLADSHINSFMRFKLALTEDNPTIKPYLEDKWAKLSDYEMPVEASLNILKGIHSRWTTLLKSLSEKDLKKTFYHPEMQQKRTLEETIGLYAWHGNHHLNHIMLIKYPH